MKLNCHRFNTSVKVHLCLHILMFHPTVLDGDKSLLQSIGTLTRRYRPTLSVVHRWTGVTSEWNDGKGPDGPAAASVANDHATTGARQANFTRLMGMGHSPSTDVSLQYLTNPILTITMILAKNWCHGQDYYVEVVTRGILSEEETRRGNVRIPTHTHCTDDACAN